MMKDSSSYSLGSARNTLEKGLADVCGHLVRKKEKKNPESTIIANSVKPKKKDLKNDVI